MDEGLTVGKGYWRFISYKGDFAQDLKHGEKGELIQRNGNVYVGDFKNDIKEGKGKATLKNGDTYVGNVANDQA